MEYKIKEETVNTLLAYLKDKPYVEVYQVIQLLQSLEPIKAKKDKK